MYIHIYIYIYIYIFRCNLSGTYAHAKCEHCSMSLKCTSRRQCRRDTCSMMCIYHVRHPQTPKACEKTPGPTQPTNKQHEKENRKRTPGMREALNHKCVQPSSEEAVQWSRRLGHLDSGAYACALKSLINNFLQHVTQAQS